MRGGATVGNAFERLACSTLRFKVRKASSVAAEESFVACTMGVGLEVFRFVGAMIMPCFERGGTFIARAAGIRIDELILRTGSFSFEEALFLFF